MGVPLKMAIEYDLVLGAQHSVQRVAVATEVCNAATYLGLIDGSTSCAEIIEHGGKTRNGTYFAVVDAAPDPGRPWNLVRDELGFTPSVRVAFRLDKFHDTLDQLDDIIRLTSALLDRIPGDAVLHREYEYILLLRRDGELTINERDDLWPPDRLALVTQPYRRATHRFS